MFAYVSIGNSDDKLTQQRWADFCIDLHGVLEEAGRIRGEWYSAPDSPYQNACTLLEMTDNADVARIVRGNIASLAYTYGQDSIAWAIVDRTDFISAAAPA